MLRDLSSRSPKFQPSNHHAVEVSSVASPHDVASFPIPVIVCDTPCCPVEDLTTREDDKLDQEDVVSRETVVSIDVLAISSPELCPTEIFEVSVACSAADQRDAPPADVQRHVEEESATVRHDDREMPVKRLSQREDANDSDAVVALQPKSYSQKLPLHVPKRQASAAPIVSLLGAKTRE